VTVAKSGYSTVTQRVVVQGTGACVSPGAVDLDVIMTPIFSRS